LEYWEKVERQASVVRLGETERWESKENQEKMECAVCKVLKVLTEIPAPMVGLESVQQTFLSNKARQECQDHQVNPESTVSTASTGWTGLLVKQAQQALEGHQVDVEHVDLLANRGMMERTDSMESKEFVELRDPLAQKAT